MINERIPASYVRNWDEFRFEPGALTALRKLASWAPRIVILTNQQGIGKGLMSTANLDDIHSRMREAILTAGGRIDDIRYCPHLTGAGCDCRKPQPGMPLAYLSENPQLRADLSVMVGDSDSDIEMGDNLARMTGGCATVRIGPVSGTPASLTFPSLADFAASISGTRVTQSAE